MASSANKASKTFRGDHEGLIDHLLEVCHEHKTRPSAEYTGFGRELVPYFSEEQPLPMDASNRRKPVEANSPQRLQKGRKNSPPTARASSARDFPSRRAAKTSDFTCEVSSARFPSSPISTGGRKSADVSPPPRSVFMGSSPPAGAAVCPGIFSSPKPETLPMPTTGLLKRATSVKACIPALDSVTNLYPLAVPPAAA
eukprot:CAMPEP_0202907250 /NCGR_PEP_ID=MMETSP1392-20130828/41829_1 /ASSEMBLY_ACC=CAM_ASM_000868 /TAXON_ID=225041 /ORGANISM="Chlamydomonas chlamydogama, Strain SAG 11-48b" /LENGTH=197 /DNA_ID=CAMNT_0049596063 /DNA_START=219 /DNA_END=812 /DNA_ORIENTATION=+